MPTGCTYLAHMMGKKFDSRYVIPSSSSSSPSCIPARVGEMGMVVVVGRVAGGKRDDSPLAGVRALKEGLVDWNVAGRCAEEISEMDSTVPCVVRLEEGTAPTKDATLGSIIGPMLTAPPVRAGSGSTDGTGGGR